MERVICITCKMDITVVQDSVKFKCPNCGKTEIIRCGKCRKLGVPYTCSECGFEGP